MKLNLQKYTKKKVTNICLENYEIKFIENRIYREEFTRKKV